MKFISSGQNIHGTTGVASSLQSLAMSLLQSTRCLMDCSAFRSTGSQRLLKLFSLFPLTYSSLFSLDSYVLLSPPPLFFFNTCSHPLLLFSFTYFFYHTWVPAFEMKLVAICKALKGQCSLVSRGIDDSCGCRFFFFRVTSFSS